MATVLGDLSESGYDAFWQCIPASAVSLPHLRNRIFIIAYDRSKRKQGVPEKPLSRLYAFPWRENERRLENWEQRPDLHGPRLCRSRNGISKRLDSIGNSVVPEIVTQIGAAILEGEG